jgi:hypothetical protein
MRKLQILSALSLGVITMPASARPSRLLLGGWVQAGDDCDGDNGVTYAANRTWSAYDVSGRWTLRGNKLFITILQRGAPTERSRRFIPTERHTFVIEPFETKNDREVG